MDRLTQAAIAVLGVPLATVGYIVLVEKLLGLAPDRARARVRPQRTTPGPRRSFSPA